MQSVGIEPTLLRTCALSMRLNHSAKSAAMPQTAKFSEEEAEKFVSFASFGLRAAKTKKTNEWDCALCEMRLPFVLRSFP